MGRTDGFCSLWQNLKDSDSIGSPLDRTPYGLGISHSTFRSTKVDWQDIGRISFRQSDNGFLMGMSRTY